MLIVSTIKEFCENKDFKKNWDWSYNPTDKIIRIWNKPEKLKGYGKNCNLEFKLGDVKEICIESSELCIAFKDRTMVWLVGYEPRMSVETNVEYNPLLDE